MASTEVACERLQQLDAEALEALQALVADSGWNQLPEDWALFHAAGTILVLRDGSGRIVASGAVLPMDEAAGGVSWISMILVHSSQRGQGLGRTVFAACLQEVRSSGRIAMLDATPAGEALYRQFGFESLWRLTRWRRDARAASAPIPGEPCTRTAPLVELDAEALGFPRPRVIAGLANRPQSRCVRSGDALGLLRAGRTAHHLGPLLAADAQAAAALLTQVAAGIAGPLLADVPDGRPAMRAALEAAGFQPQRGFARMALAPAGQLPPAGQLAFLHAIAGPEFA